ncbi:MAG: hypothetical protein WCR46_11805 [Deltaproteobacteria bacterium]
MKTTKSGRIRIVTRTCPRVSLSLRGQATIEGDDLRNRFPGGDSVLYEFSIGSSSVIVANLTKNSDETINIPTVFTIGHLPINDLRRIHSVRYPKEVVLKEGKEAVIRPLEKQDEGLLGQFYAELPDSDRWFMRYDVLDSKMEFGPFGFQELKCRITHCR